MRDRIASSLRWVFIAKLSGQVINWAITFLVLRLLAPSDYGLMAMAMIFITIAAVFSDLGLGVALVQARDISSEQISEIFGLLIIIALSLCVVLIAMAIPAAKFFSEPRLALLIPALSSQFVINAFSTVPKAALQRELSFKPLAGIEISSALVSGLMTLGLAWLDNGVWSLVFGNLAGQLCGCVATNLASANRVAPRLVSSRSAKLLVVGCHITTSRTMWTIVSQADAFIVGRTLGKDALGAYSVALQLAAMPMYKIMAVVNQVALTGFSRIQHDHQQVRHSILTGISIIGIIAFPLFFGLSALSKELIEVLLGSKWEEAALPLQILPLIIPFRMTANFLSTAAQGIGRTDIDMQNTAYSLIALPPAFYIGAHFGLLGVCLVWLTAMPVLLIFSIRRLLKSTGLSYADLIATLKAPFAYSLLAYLAVLMASPLLPADTNAATRLASLILVGGLAYFGSFWLLSKSEMLRVWRLIHDRNS